MVTTSGTTRPTTTKKNRDRTKVLWILLPIVLGIVYQKIDASPTLFLYDLMLTVTPENRFALYTGKTVWITGASSGIGAEVVCQLAEAGASRIILSARRVDELKKVAENCTKRWTSLSTAFSIVAYDAMDNEATESTVEKALVGGSIDALFLCTGIYHMNPAIETPHDQLRAVSRVNFESGVEVFQTLVRIDKWKERGHGHVIVIDSVAGHLVIPLLSIYAASKHALRAYFLTVAAEESSWLRVNIACPGPVNTEIWSKIGLRGVKFLQMPVDRTVRLILTGTVGPKLLFYETIIGAADVQISLFLNIYFPNVYHALQPLVARIRLARLKLDQFDEFSFIGLAHGVVQILVGKL